MTGEERATAPKWEPALTQETEKLLGAAEKTTGLRSNGKTFLWIRKDLASFEAIQKSH